MGLLIGKATNVAEKKILAGTEDFTTKKKNLEYAVTVNNRKRIHRGKKSCVKTS